MQKNLITAISLGLIGTKLLLPIKDINTIYLLKDNIIPVVIGHNDSRLKHSRVNYLEGTSYIDDYGQVIITNVNDNLVLVNKDRNLPYNYKPMDLVIPKVTFSFNGDHDKRYLRQDAALALEELFQEAQKENIILYAISGYRSYFTQKLLFDNKSRAVGHEKANLLVAKPGQSEHQTGLAMDISSKSINFVLEEYFKDTAEAKWLEANAHKYGFIIRYQEDTTEITGYSYEPWHVRYVGKEFATEIYETNITLEEFLGDR